MMRINKYLPLKPSKKRAFLLIFGVIFLYLLDNPFVTSRIGSQSFILFLQPAAWCWIILLLLLSPRIGFRSKLKYKSLVNGWALNFAVIFLAVSFIAGLIDGLGKSPYDHSVMGILRNAWAVAPLLIGRELIKNELVHTFTNEENYFVFTMIAFLITLTTFPLNKYSSLGKVEAFVQFVAEYFAPEFSKNLLSTYLAFLAGPFPAMIYMGILSAFHWFSPILPDLKWITTALIGILCPVFCLISMQNIYGKAAKVLKKSDEENESPLSWMITSVISIGLIWFAVGVFSVYPSVVITGSMKPMINPGDIVLVSKFKSVEEIHKLQVGDIIQYKKGDILVFHRIIEVIEENGVKSFRTKGDNNSGADVDLVRMEQIRGRMVLVIPKIGWPTLLLKSNKDIQLDEIEF